MFRALLCSTILLVACGGSRGAFVRYPGAPATFDRAASDPKAVEIAEKVFAAAGGPGNWEKAKQLRWEETVTSNGQVKGGGEEAWDRWNARHWGRLSRDDGDVVVGYEIYGAFSMGYLQRGKMKENLDAGSKSEAIAVAKSRFGRDTAALALQFLMFEPGAKLTYVGPAQDDAGPEGADDIQVTFADPARKDYELHAIVDRGTNLLARIEMTKAGTGERIGYALSGWTTVAGLKFATARKDLGSSDTIAIGNIRVSDPDDDLFVAPLQ